MNTQRSFLLLALWVVAALLPVPGMADETIGGACSGTVADGAQSANGNNTVCVSSIWQYPAYQFGNSSATCNGTNAGIIKWTGAAFQGCNGSWGAISSTSLINLGDTMTSANPYISGDLTSGFYTSAAARVDVAISAANVEEWASTGETIVGSLTANSFIPTSATVPANGMYLSGANTLDFSTNSGKRLEISSTGNLNIATSTAQLQIAGANVLGYADSGNDTTSFALGASGLAAQTTINLNNTAIGYLAGEFTSTGTGNTYAGYNAGLGFTTTNVTGSDNTAAGASALLRIQGTAASNTAVGASAGSAITTGTNNTILGYAVASTTLSTGSANILIGTDSTTDVALANTSSAIGIGTGVIVGTMDTGIGYQALQSTTTNNLGNTAAGYQAGQYISTGGAETALGYQALQSVSGAKLTGSDNTAVGALALAKAQGAAANNTGVGALAASALTTGTNNTVIGYGVASTTLTTGSANILIGTDTTTDTALSGTSSAVAIGTGVIVGTGDVGIGYYALHSTTTNNLGNTAVGFEAGEYISSGPRNTAVGYQAMMGSSGAKLTGSDNTAVGDRALTTIQSGASYNTAIGAFALTSLTTANGDTAVGFDAEQNETVGSYNVAFGSYAMQNFQGVSNDVAIGNYALQGAASPYSSGTGNTAMGYAALQSSQGTTCCNTAFGYYALQAVTTGQYNTAMGYQAGYAGTANTVGTYNTFIGYQAQANANNYTNSTALGNGAIITASNSIVLGNSSISHIYAEVTSITGISDRRRKKDIADLDLGLEFIEKLRPVSYRFSNGDDTLRYGFVAQDIEKALPPPLQDLIETSKPEHRLALIERQNDSDRTYRVAYDELLAPLVKSMQQQEDEIDGLKAVRVKRAAELDELRRRMASLEGKR